jgi:hypothetical protein
MRSITIAVAWLAIAGAVAAEAAETLTYVDLVNRLVDLERVAALLAAGERCAQWSSYDRASRYDEATGKYVNWNANADGTGIIREEDGKQVLAEMAGPGVIWRFWMAHAGKGHIKMYLDGAETPAVDLPAVGFFDGEHEPFTRKQLCYVASRGWDCYVPIPYQKSCKIVAEPGWGRYYQFTYATYPKGTQLPTFRRELAKEEAAALDRVDSLLAAWGEDPAGRRAEERTRRVSVVAGAGETVTVADLAGPRAITALKVKMALPPSPADYDPLRELVLRIWWDGAEAPAVLTPLGDFFGTAPGVAEYRSLPMGMTKDAFYSYWYMPFDQGALIEVVNDGAQDWPVEFAITHAPLERPVKAYGRFYARWHRDADLDPARAIDWTILKTQGRGRFCGVMLHIWNPRGGWWGEGDEKFFVDGEKFPSTYGTGSEDYFGYAWCNEGVFHRAFHNQTVSVPKNPCAFPTPEESGGHTCNNRWQIADNIPFQESFLGTIEKYFGNERPTRYACVAYWYQAPPPRSLPRLAPVAQRDYRAIEYETMMVDFLRSAKAIKSAEGLAPLREAYQALMGRGELANDRVHLALRMAAAETRTGHAARANRLLKPFLAELTEPFIRRDEAPDVREALGLEKPGAMVRPFLVEHIGDGSVKRVEKDGRWCIVTQCDRAQPFIYFALPADAGLRNVDQTVRMAVVVYSDGKAGGALKIHYDSYHRDDILGHYWETPALAVPETPGWHTLTFECPRARLAGHQNGRSDFRIAAVGAGDVCVADVQVHRPE